MAALFPGSKNRVPVAHRRADAKLKPAQKRTQSWRIGVVELIVLTTLLIVFLITIALPLRNYFEQRNQIKEINIAIAQKQARKEELLGELERYRNPAYVEEQARNRLGVIAPGEVPFRILDPTMSKQESLTSSGAEETQQKQNWYDSLWASVVDPAPVVTGETETPPTPEMKLPVEPAAP